MHGFGWLRNLAAAGDDEARETARRLATEWANRFGGGSGVGAEPAVIARRLISWISYAALLLDDADAASYETITLSLGRQLAVAQRDVEGRTGKLSAPARAHRAGAR